MQQSTMTTGCLGVAGVKGGGVPWVKGDSHATGISDGSLVSCFPHLLISIDIKCWGQPRIEGSITIKLAASD